MAALAAGHVEVALGFAARRDGHSLRGAIRRPCTLGMSLRPPGNGSAVMFSSSQLPARGEAMLIGCWILARFLLPQVHCSSDSPYPARLVKRGALNHGKKQRIPVAIRRVKQVNGGAA